MTDIMEKLLKDLLSYYLSLDDVLLEMYLSDPNTGIKQRVDTIGDLQVIVYPGDHEPPHFHVKTKDLDVDAKFKIENCEYISGRIGNKNLKKIEAFYLGPKGKIVLSKIWNRYQENKK